MLTLYVFQKCLFILDYISSQKTPAFLAVAMKNLNRWENYVFFNLKLLFVAFSMIWVYPCWSSNPVLKNLYLKMALLT